MRSTGFRSGDLGHGHERFVTHGWSHSEIASDGHCKELESETFVQQRQGKYAVVAWNLSLMHKVGLCERSRNLYCVCDFVYFSGFRPIHECRDPLLYGLLLVVLFEGRWLKQVTSVHSRLAISINKAPHLETDLEFLIT